jgi:hypothetical protein
MPTRKQHYVNQFYLEPWTENGQLASMIRGKILPNALANVANQRDFYEVAELSSEDITFLKHVVIAPSPDGVKPILEELLYSYALVGAAHRRLAEDANLSEKELQVLRNLKLEFDEKYHAKIEEDLHTPLRQMRKGGTDFFEDVNLVGPFFRSIALQYFRTKRMRAAMRARLGSPIPGASMDRIWRPMIHMHAINAGRSFFGQRSELRLLLLDSPPDERFITGDQPIVNLVDELDVKGVPLGLEWYYPISPTRAMILANQASPRMSVNRVPTSEEMTGYNRRIVEAHHEQLYADSASRLENWQQLALLAGGWS